MEICQRTHRDIRCAEPGEDRTHRSMRPDLTWRAKKWGGHTTSSELTQWLLVWNKTGTRTSYRNHPISCQVTTILKSVLTSKSTERTRTFIPNRLKLLTWEWQLRVMEEANQLPICSTKEVIFLGLTLWRKVPDCRESQGGKWKWNTYGGDV